MTIRITFRVDASLVIGSGHVMRCLTLAEALSAQGAKCHFICRAQPGHMLELIARRGFSVSALPVPARQAAASAPDGPGRDAGHSSWLGCDWQADARETADILASLDSDWLVVDHYGIDQRWEEALQSYYKQLLVIDDLADRPHRSDVLLDQNLGRTPQDYAALVPAACQVLTGPKYALLHAEFSVLRAASMAGRVNPSLKRVLVTMGGVDLPNATARVLVALADSALPQDCRITVVMGEAAPWLEQVRELATRLPWPTEVVVNISDMARRMADSDLAIGAAGGTSWERCCVGLPTVLVVLADNQRAGATALQASGAARLVGDVDQIAVALPATLAALNHGHELRQLSSAAAAITDGQGVGKVLRAMGVQHD
jgi:UDP-2,4-diacetamido-2,4,6-trideoxy-beta-L-altropyranose hydrolase